MLLKLKKKKIILDKDATTCWICLELKQIYAALRSHNGKRLKYHQDVIEGMLVILGSNCTPVLMDIERLSIDTEQGYIKKYMEDIYYKLSTIFGELSMSLEEITSELGIV